MKNNKWMIVFVLFFLGIFIAIIFRNKISITKNTAENIDLFHTEKMAVSSPVNTTQNLSLLPTNEVESNHIFTPAEIMERQKQAVIVKDWMRKHGYEKISTEADDYDTYSQDTLKELAFNGDEIAIEKLGRLYWVEQSSRVAISFYRDVAARGSTRALYHMGGIFSSERYDNASTPEAKKAVAIQVLALSKVAAMRGDRFAETFANTHLYHVLADDNIVLSDADNDQIKTRAQAIYADLQKYRNELGLGLFDNAEPEEVKQNFDALQKLFKQ